MHIPRPRPRRRRGCAMWLFLGVLAVFMACGLSLAVYAIAPPPALNIVIMGLDARPGEGRFARSDSIMLLNVNPGRLRVSMLSIPRDIFIQVPGYGIQRINTINLLGEQEAVGRGIGLLQEALERNFNIEVQRFVRLNFDGFERLIDAIGGVDIYVERVIEDWQYPTIDGGTMNVRFSSGWQHMDGERALIYARTRHSDDDYQRARRQQQVLSAVAQKLVNPVYWPAALAALYQATETDLRVTDMAGMLLPVLLSGDRIERRVIERADLLSGDGYVTPNYAALAPWVEQHLK